MADNLNVTPGTGVVIAADDISSVLYQRIKLTMGADGAADMDLDSGQQTMANSLPVAIASNQSAIPVTDNSTTLSVDDGGSTLSIDDGAGNISIDDGGNIITVDGTVIVNGSVAHDSASSGNPLLHGGYAESTRPAAVADADAVRAWFDLVGRQIVQVGSGEFSYVSAEYTTNQTDTSLISTPGAGLSIVIYDIVVSTAGAGSVLFEEGGSTRLFGRITLAANGGWSFNSSKGVKMTANTALTITTTTSTAVLSVFVNYAVVP